MEYSDGSVNKAGPASSVFLLRCSKKYDMMVSSV